MSDLKWFLLLFVFLWLVWFATGGPAKYIDKQNQFVKDPQAPGQPKEIYNFQQLPNR